MKFLVALSIALATSPLAARAQTQDVLQHASVPSPVAAVTPQLADLPNVNLSQVSLTPEAVARFLASLPAMTALARDLDREQGNARPIRIDENLGVLLVPHLFVPHVAARIDRELKRVGFASYGEWADIAYSVGLAAEASEFTGAIDLKEQKESLRREIQNDAKTTPEEKKAALMDLERKFAALAESEPRPGNREAVEPFLERLHAAVKGG